MSQVSDFENGYGSGSGYGDGYGFSHGDSDGFGDGFSHGDSDGYGAGYGDGFGDGFGDGDGEWDGSGRSNGGTIVGSMGEHGVFSLSPWPYVRVGCRSHSIGHWAEHWRAIAVTEHVEVAETEVAQLIAQCRSSI